MKNSIILALLMVFIGWVHTPGFGQGVKESNPAPAAIVAKRLSPPPTVATPGKGAASAKTRLVLVSKKANAITDDEAWFAQNGVTMPDLHFGVASPEDYGDLPRGSILTFGGMRLQRALNTANSGTNRVLQIQGKDRSSGQYLVCLDGFNGDVIYALDFSSYGSPASQAKVATTQPIDFAYEDKNGILYVANGINGYAKEADNKTGYVTALEPKTGRMLWRSGPLTQNASTFADLGDVLVCGYGFTDEPDFVYLLDKRVGRTVQTIPVKSGPSVILRKGDRVYVRCYDTDYVFAIKKGE